MCHNYLGGMYLRTFSKNLHPTQFPLWLYYQKTPAQARDQNTSFLYNQKKH